MAAGAPSELTRRVQHDLASGRSREDIVQDLVAGGLSSAGAERFVDRVLAAHSGATSSTDAGEASRRPDPETSGGVGSLVFGILWLSLSFCISALIFLLTEEGEGLLFGPAVVSVGLVLFVRGLLRWRDSFAPFPRAKVIAAGVFPVLGSVVFLGLVSLRESRLQEAEARAEAEVKMEQERAEAERIQQKTATEERVRARTEAARVARREQDAKRVQRHMETLRTSSRASSICNAARQLASYEEHDAIRDLESVLHGSTSTRARYCVAQALMDLGETHAPLAFYMDGARSSDKERRRVAIGALGDFGSAEADATLPYIDHALRSAEESDRFAAVLALSRMGEAGEPLLRHALNDPVPRIRDYAAQVLGE